jgi:hypothetical protein
MRPRRWPRSVHAKRRQCPDLAPMSGSGRSLPSTTRRRRWPPPCVPSALPGLAPPCARTAGGRRWSPCWRFEPSSTSWGAGAAPRMPQQERGRSRMLAPWCGRQRRRRRQPGGRQTGHRGQQWLPRGRPWSQWSGATVHLSSGRQGAAGSAVSTHSPHKDPTMRHACCRLGETCGRASVHLGPVVAGFRDRQRGSCTCTLPLNVGGRGLHREVCSERSGGSACCPCSYYCSVRFTQNAPPGPLLMTRSP